MSTQWELFSFDGLQEPTVCNLEVRNRSWGWSKPKSEALNGNKWRSECCRIRSLETLTDSLDTGLSFTESKLTKDIGNFFIQIDE